MTLILTIILCFQIYRMARERSISPWSFMMNFLSAFFLVLIAFSYSLVAIFGVDALMSEEGKGTIMKFEPFVMLFVVFLFLFFRKRIQKSPVSSNRDDNDFNPPSPPTKEKKDLSYFR